MARRIEPVTLAGPAGALEAQLLLPAAPRAGAALVCHPHPLHGGTMHTKAVHRTARAFESLGLAALRFQFRGVGRSAGTWTGGPGETADAAAALAWLAARYPSGPLFAAGFSFGSWVGLRAAVSEPRVRALVAIAPPIEMYDFSFLATDARPLLCVAGDRDPICPAPQLETFVAGLGARAQLVRLRGAAHLLTTHLAELHDAVARFVAGCL